MPFTVAPKAVSPTPVSEGRPAAPSAAQQSAKARALAILSGGSPKPSNAQPEAVLNPSKVSVEELPAIKSKLEEEQQPHSPTVLETSQIDTSETPVEAQAAVEASKPEAKAEEPISSQYAQLARKERAMRQQAQDIKAKELALKAREDAIAAKEAPKPVDPQAAFKAKFDKDPLGAMAEMGYTWDQLTERALEAPDPKETKLLQHISKLEARLEELAQGQEKTVKSFEQQQQDSYKQAVSQIKMEAKKLVYTDPNFETIKAAGSVDDVVELIESTFKDGMGGDHPPGTLLSVQEAAQLVEDYLVEEAVKLAKLKKIQDKIKPVSAPAATAKPSAESSTKQPQPVRTLTNAQTSSRPLSARERAILAFKGEKKVS